MNLQDIRNLFDYTEWANELPMDAADSLSDEQLEHDFGISHGSIFGTLTHMAGAEWIWLERWSGRSPAKAPLASILSRRLPAMSLKITLPAASTAGPSRKQTTAAGAAAVCLATRPSGSGVFERSWATHTH